MQRLVNTHKIANETILFSLLFLGCWLLFPVISIFLFLAFFFRYEFGRKTENFMLVLMSISFGLIAYTTRSFGTTDSDIARYYDLYLHLATVDSIQDFFLSFVFNGSSNILFYLVTYTH